MIKDSVGVKHNVLSEVINCWEEHFKVHLNTAFPHNPDAMNDIPATIPSSEHSDPPSEEEIRDAVKSLKSGKAPGSDEITPEVLKAGGDHMIQMLLKISKKVWEEERSPLDWSRMLVSKNVR